VPQTPFFAQYQHHFLAPPTLEGWSQFSYSSQKLYRNPSAALEKMLFRHHVKIHRMFPGIESYKTFDVWQERYHAAPVAGKPAGSVV